MDGQNQSPWIFKYSQRDKIVHSSATQGLKMIANLLFDFDSLIIFDNWMSSRKAVEEIVEQIKKK